MTNGYRKLTAGQVDAFHTHGYLKLGRLLDAATIELLRREYDREFERARSGATSFRNLAIDDTDDVAAKNEADAQMLQITQMCERNLHFRRLLYHEAILDCVEDLIGPNIQLFHDQALYKPAHHGGPVFWHQDNAYWQCLPANLVSCWMTLDDVTVDNGAMQVIPGSHVRALEHEHAASTNALLDNAERGGQLPSGGDRAAGRGRHAAPLSDVPLHRPQQHSARAARLRRSLHDPRHQIAPHRQSPPDLVWTPDAAHAGVSRPLVQLRSAGRLRSSSRMALAQELRGSMAR